MDGTCTTRRELWRRKSFHTLGSPFTGGDDGGWQGGSFGAMEESEATGVQRAKWRDSCTENQCRPALTSLTDLSARPPAGKGGGWELMLWLQRSDPRERTQVGCVNKAKGASAPASWEGVREKVWTCLRGKRAFFRGAKERGFRALAKQAPETGGSCGYQHRHQRQAWHAMAAAAVTMKPVCKHGSLSIPPLLGVCAAHHCQDPMIQGQLPWENTRCTSGCCNVKLASAPAGSHRIPYPSFPHGLNEPEPPN